MQRRFLVLSVVSAIFFATPAPAALYVSASVHGTQLEEGDRVVIFPGFELVIDISISTDRNPDHPTPPAEGEALALGLRVADYDPIVLVGGTATIVPPSIFDFSPSIPFGGLPNSASGDEEGPRAGVRPGTSINLFQGVRFGPAAGFGPETFQVRFVGGAPGVTTVRIGALAEYRDTYLAAGADPTATPLSFTVTMGDDLGDVWPPIPEPTTALLLGLGLTGLAWTRPRRRLRAVA